MAKRISVVMNERDAEQFVQQLQMLEMHFSDLSKLEENLLGLIRDITNVIDALNAMLQNPESDSLISLGVGVSVPAKIPSDCKVVMEIGAGVTVEKDCAYTINHLESRIKEAETALRETSAKKHNVALQLEQGRAQINQLMQMRQNKTATG